jgi:hypothetical protein
VLFKLTSELYDSCKQMVVEKYQFIAKFIMTVYSETQFAHETAV